MSNKQSTVQNCGIKLFQIAVFVFAFYLIQTTASAQVAPGKQNRISSVFSGKCVIARNIVKGEQIVQMTCAEDFEPFFFQFAGVQFGLSLFEIKIKDGNKCLDVSGGGTGNGTPVILWDCHGGKNQLWTTNPIGEGFQIRSAQSGKCLDVRGPSRNDGTPIQIWDCGNASVKQMIYKITDIDIISDGSTSPASDSGGTGLTLQQADGVVDKTSTLIEQFSSDNALSDGNSVFFTFAGSLGKALKIAGAAAGLFDILLDITKQDTPSFEEKTLTNFDRVIRQLDGLESRQKQQFDDLKIFLKEQQAYDRLFKSDNVVDSQFSLWRANKINLKVEANTQIPEYKSADDFINEASAIGNLCSGQSGGTPIYDAVAAANQKRFDVLPELHILISGKLSKAGTLGVYQRYRASYLTNLKSMTKKPNLVSNGVENQIAEIEKFEKAANSNISFAQLRTPHLQNAKKQFDNEIEPHWSKCEKALNAAVTKYSAPVSVKEAAKMVVEKEFVIFEKDRFTFVSDKLPLLLTNSDSNTYEKGRGLGATTKLDGSFDPSLAGGRFAAALGKRLEALFPGYGFVVVAYSQYDSIPTIRSNVSNRCTGAAPMNWGFNDASRLSIVKSDNQPLVWQNILVDGPLRICSGRADQYSFNLIVSGFRLETLAGDAKTWLSTQVSLTRPALINYSVVVGARKDSEEFGKSTVAAASGNIKPNVVSVFAALPGFANGRRADGVYYLYPSKVTDMVFYPSTPENLFYVVSPNPF